MQLTQDMKRAVKEVPPWGWGIIGIGTLYLVVRARKPAAGTTAGGSSTAQVGSSTAVTDPSGGMSAYIEGLNSGYQTQAETWAQELQNLQDSNAQLMQNVGSIQASQGTGGLVAPPPADNTPTVPTTDPGNLGGPYLGTVPVTATPIQYDPTQYQGAVDVSPYQGATNVTGSGSVGSSWPISLGAPPPPPTSYPTPIAAPAPVTYPTPVFPDATTLQGGGLSSVVGNLGGALPSSPVPIPATPTSQLASTATDLHSQVLTLGGATSLISGGLRGL